MATTATKKETKKKFCTACHQELPLSHFYMSKSPLHSLDGKVPICKDCALQNSLNEETGEIDEVKFKNILRQLDKPYYLDNVISAQNQFAKEHGYIPEDEVKYHGADILKIYYKNINSLRQLSSKSYADSEKDGFVQKNSTVMTTATVKNNKPVTNISSTTISKKVEEELVYSEFWMGDYSQRDIDLLDKYYAGLNRDYKIVTENHRDYAKKIAKASLMMDKAYEDMLKGVSGADKMYSSAKDIFDSLSKSAKFSEDKRSINDVGISSFSKITSIVENHNWIPQHVPKEKDMYDEMLEALSVINKSV